MIDNFQSGPYRFLMNSEPVDIDLDGEIYPSVEHAFQAAKCALLYQRDAIRLAISAKEAKHIGQRVALRENWDSIKNAVMSDLLQQKFSHPSLRAKLLATRNHALVAGDDTYWGKVNGEGENFLGRLLMDIRDDIYEESLNALSQSCRSFLLSLGWERCPDGDEMWEECWVGPDSNLQLSLFEAVQWETSGNNVPTDTIFPIGLF